MTDARLGLPISAIAMAALLSLGACAATGAAAPAPLTDADTGASRTVAVGSVVDVRLTTQSGTGFSWIAEPVKGLTVGVGLDYLDKRPGDAPSGTPTSASTPTNIIMPQPTFWLPARTLVNASIVYAWNTHYKAQLNIDNLFDEDYLAASINRYMVIPGTPLNARLTVTYTF